MNKKAKNFKDELERLEDLLDIEQKEFKFDVEEFRARIKIEDNLLNTRMNIFITLSALWLVVVSFIKDGTTDFNVTLPFILIGIVINIIWLICSYQSRRIISYLTNIVVTKLGKIEENEIKKRNAKEKSVFYNKRFVEKTVQYALPNYIFQTRPTDLLSIWLPFLILNGWGFLVLSEIGKLNFKECLLLTIGIIILASVFLYVFEKFKLNSFKKLTDQLKIFK